MRDARYKLVRLRFNEGKIKKFSDIIYLVPKSIIADDLGKKKERFSQLIEHPEEFTVKELLLVGRFCALTLPEMLFTIEEDCKKFRTESLKKKDDRYQDVRDMFTEGEIRTLKDIFEFIPRYVVATYIGIKRQRLGRLINQVENFQVRELLELGGLFDLSVSEIFQLTSQTYAKRKK